MSLLLIFVLTLCLLEPSFGNAVEFMSKTTETTKEPTVEQTTTKNVTKPTDAKIENRIDKKIMDTTPDKMGERHDKKTEATPTEKKTDKRGLFYNYHHVNNRNFQTINQDQNQHIHDYNGNNIPSINYQEQNKEQKYYLINDGSSEYTYKNNEQENIETLGKNINLGTNYQSDPTPSYQENNESGNSGVVYDYNRGVRFSNKPILEGSTFIHSNLERPIHLGSNLHGANFIKSNAGGTSIQGTALGAFAYDFGTHTAGHQNRGTNHPVSLQYHYQGSSKFNTNIEHVNQEYSPVNFHKSHEKPTYQQVVLQGTTPQSQRGQNIKINPDLNTDNTNGFKIGHIESSTNVQTYKNNQKYHSTFNGRPLLENFNKQNNILQSQVNQISAFNPVFSNFHYFQPQTSQKTQDIYYNTAVPQVPFNGVSRPLPNLPTQPSYIAQQSPEKPFLAFIEKPYLPKVVPNFKPIIPQYSGFSQDVITTENASKGPMTIHNLVQQETYSPLNNNNKDIYSTTQDGSSEQAGQTDFQDYSKHIDIRELPKQNYQNSFNDQPNSDLNTSPEAERYNFRKQPNSVDQPNNFASQTNFNPQSPDGKAKDVGQHDNYGSTLVRGSQTALQKNPQMQSLATAGLDSNGFSNTYNSQQQHANHQNTKIYSSQYSAEGLQNHESQPIRHDDTSSGLNPQRHTLDSIRGGFSNTGPQIFRAPSLQNEQISQNSATSQNQQRQQQASQQDTRNYNEPNVNQHGFQFIPKYK